MIRDTFTLIEVFVPATLAAQAYGCKVHLNFELHKLNELISLADEKLKPLALNICFKNVKMQRKFRKTNAKTKKELGLKKKGNTYSD